MTDMPGCVFDRQAWNLWNSKWSATPYERSAPYREYIEYGTEQEPASSIWCSIFAEALGETFKDGIALVDYGCGAGRFFGFMSERLTDFRYFGLEKAGQPTGLGELSIQRAEADYGNDPRATFGYIGSPVENQAFEAADACVFMSVFTHMSFKGFEDAIHEHAWFAKRNKLVFSLFLDEETQTWEQECEGVDWWGMTAFNPREVSEAGDRAGLRLAEVGRFTCDSRRPIGPGRLEHVIYEAVRRQPKVMLA